MRRPDRTSPPPWDRTGPALTVLLADGYRSRPDALLDGMARAGHSGALVGAAASENGSHGRTYQFYGDQVTSNSVVGFALSGGFETVIDITQGCQPVGDPMIITKADENLIFEIDGRPAFEVFVELIGKPFQQDLRRALAFVFAGLPPDPQQTEIEPGQYLVRNIIGLDAQRGIVAVAQPVEAGQPLIFTLRDGQRAREDLGQMLARQRGPSRGQEAAAGPLLQLLRPRQRPLRRARHRYRLHQAGAGRRAGHRLLRQLRTRPHGRGQPPAHLHRGLGARDGVRRPLPTGFPLSRLCQNTLKANPSFPRKLALDPDRGRESRGGGGALQRRFPASPHLDSRFRGNDDSRGHSFARTVF